MNEFDWQAKKLTTQCPELLVSTGHQELLKTLNALFAPLNLEFDLVLERAGWHRLGGVVDLDMKPVASHLRAWAEAESGGDVEVLLDKYAGQPLFATRLEGHTLYFTAPTGDRPEYFLQIEIEICQEMLDRPLFDPDFLPDNLEEFLDPIDYPRLEPELIGQAQYHFRSLHKMVDIFLGQNPHSRHVQNLNRFMQDWRDSSAGQNEDAPPFCSHWVMVLQEYQGSDKESHFNIKPTSTFAQKVTAFDHAAGLHGAELAKTIHAFDRQVGYPFAWFFLMLNRRGVPASVADAVLRDQMEAYDYLPARDLKILREWEKRPYSV
ncbi:hypothetical protein VSS37_19490 [Candidatus Thiothrix sp. Deng01]|uniref:Uncharacterized protein n=1 Tax=Candidatus Thiothrix phosphatis TaxID=3112415 RepID=A0ABU6D273_9GAMM|nr:hypothetical protein [Candidatus Thiothrix sp. Deng01]MEB4593171.1 hypothetical protein [Candidatus Thiothrix sp. Deng01]